MFHRAESVHQFGRIGQTTYRRSHKAEQLGKLGIILDVITFLYIGQICLFKQALQIVHPRAIIRQRKQLRQSTVGQITVECLLACPVKRRDKLRKRQRPDTYLIASSTELGHYVVRQEA